MNEAKPFEIDKRLVYEAFKKVKSNKGSAGIDGIGMTTYEQNVGKNLYKLWNRMSSGCYFPKAVKLVEIPKSNGGTRPLGIPTIEDRIAQMAVVMAITPRIDPLFHEDSYGYRPNKSAHDAIAKVRERCMKYPWVLDMDISKFFDTINHELLMKAVRIHVKEKWMLLYIERWLKVPYQTKDGAMIERTKGVPQGSVIGPVLANLFLHYVFDMWMVKNYPHITFERYADDTICHCLTERQTRFLKSVLKVRFEECGLKLNEDKTKIVYCKDCYRKGDYENTSFDFLGFTYRPRRARSMKVGNIFTAFLPAISTKSMKSVREEIKSWNLNRNLYIGLKDIAKEVNPKISGWINYYSIFGKSEFRKLMAYLNMRLARFIKRKYKRFAGGINQLYSAYRWLRKIAFMDRNVFMHWAYGYMP